MAAGCVGDVAIPYDRDLGHVLFEPYAADIARRATERWSAKYLKSRQARE
jgi:hypothetical protein